MLKKLYIRNFAIIDELNIEFSPHLNLITGETGAGKSILVGALSMLLGQKLESKAIFKAGEKSIIEGIFEIKDLSLKEIFEDLELDYQNETILRREISSEGKSRAFINDSPVSLSLLQEIGNRLVDIHSQHETLDINQESFQVRVVDSVAGKLTNSDEFKGLLKEFKKKEKQIIAWKESLDKNTAEVDFIKFQLEEFEKAKLKDEDEQEKLEVELLELSHAEEIQKSLYQFLGILNGEERSILENLKSALGSLQSIEKFYPNSKVFIDRIKVSQIEIRDIHAEVESLTENISVNQPRIEWVQSRLNLIYGLEQKHRILNLPQLLQFERNLFQKLESLQTDDEKFHKQVVENNSLKLDLSDLAISLQIARRKVIPLIEKEIKESLKDLGILDGDFKIQLESSENSFTNYGFDRIRFLFSANQGFTPVDLSKVASGGELSRLVLAIKTLSSKYLSMPTLIFDEIDTGVSGEVALKVGRVMKNLSIKNQVIAITHLPQIASRQGDHFLVYKENLNGLTRTRLKKLDQAMRIDEVAKMLSGNSPGEFALKNSKELIENP